MCRSFKALVTNFALIWLLYSVWPFMSRQTFFFATTVVTSLHRHDFFTNVASFCVLVSKPLSLALKEVSEINDYRKRELLWATLVSTNSGYIKARLALFSLLLVRFARETLTTRGQHNAQVSCVIFFSYPLKIVLCKSDHLKPDYIRIIEVTDQKKIGSFNC